MYVWTSGLVHHQISSPGRALCGQGPHPDVVVVLLHRLVEDGGLCIFRERVAASSKPSANSMTSATRA